MEFKKYILEESISIFDGTSKPEVPSELPTPEQEYFTKEDILEMIDVLDENELQEIGEELMELLYDEEFEDEDMEESINEKKYFAKKAKEINKEKKKNKSERRKDAKKRKQMYKKNKAKIKRKQKLYKKKAKRQPNQVRTHR